MADLMIHYHLLNIIFTKEAILKFNK